MNILFDIIPAKYRRLVYAIATLGLFLYGLWEASNEDWGTFATSLLSSVVTALAAANTTAVGEEAEPGGEDPEDDDDGDDTVADVLDPDYPEHDDLDDMGEEFPNSETLYQPGEEPYERFGGPQATPVTPVAPSTPSESAFPVSGNDDGYPMTDNPHRL